jgi:SPP1 gp7 family putative phage head morphogenesis protein
MSKAPPLLIQATTRHQVYLEGYKTHAAKEFLPFLKKMAKQINTRLSNQDITDWNRQRLEKQIKAIHDDISDVYREHYKVWREQVYDLAEYEAGFEVRSLSNIVDNYDFALPSRSQLESAVKNIPFTSLPGPDKGKLLESFYAEWSMKTINSVDGIVRAGFYNGLTTPQIVRQIIGTPKLKFADGQLNKGNRDIEILTRTALQHSASVARRETGMANRDIVRGIQIVATLDGRTSEQCKARDGQIYPIETGPYPPYHPGCRTSFVYTLDERYSFLDKDATRAARGEDGVVEPVSAKQDYYHWLKDQGKDFQASVLGKKRAEVFRNGGLSVERFKELNYDKNFQQRTLKEMEELEPLVFERL